MVVSTMSREELATLVMDVLVEMFGLERATMSLESDLYADLDIDSIDAVDLAVRLKQMTGKRLQPEVFKTIRTIGDVVGALAVLSSDLSADLPAEQVP
jgi:acyl carrier protein